MRETAETSHRFPALDELGAEFLRVARTDSLPRRRLRLRRVALALAVTVIAVPAGYALAEEDEGSGLAVAADSASRPTPEDMLNSPVYTSRIQSVLQDPAIAGRLEAMGYQGVGSMSDSDFAKLDAARFLADLTSASDDYRNYLQEHPSEVKDVNVIGELPTALTQECRADPNSDSLCGIALAAADGKLPSGRYTDAELQEAVRAAGYEWSPSE